MKICIVTDTFMPQINGVSVVLKNYIEGLRERGHEVFIIRSRQPKEKRKDIQTEYKQYLIRAVTFPQYKEVRLGLPFLWKIRRIIKKEKPDVMYVATEAMLGVAASEVACSLKVPLMTGYHTHFAQYFPYYGMGLVEYMSHQYLKLFHNRGDLVLAHSKEAKIYLRSKGVHSHIVALSHGMNGDLFNIERRKEDLRKEWKVPSKRPVILYVGRLALEKNIFLFFKIIKKLKKQKFKFKAVVVGGGPLFEELQNLYPDITFVGPKYDEELAQYYASSDIFISASMTETFGNVFLEALASGLFTIGFNYAAVKRFVKHGKTGVVVTFGDEEKFIKRSIEGIKGYRVSKENREMISQTVSQWDWDYVVPQLEQLLYLTIRNNKNKDRSFISKSLRYFCNRIAAFFNKIKM